MKNLRILPKYAFFCVLFFVLFACDSPSNSENSESETAEESVEENVVDLTPTPELNAMLQKVSAAKLPSAQSFAWARQGQKMLLIGGRIEGFHGLNNTDNPFKSSKANTSLWVIDFSDFTYTEMQLDQNDENYLQFSSTNMEFNQDGDTLYVVGGFGRKKSSDAQSNYTFNRMVAIQVSTMISEVEKGTSGNLKNGILKTVNSPFLQVTGGALEKHNGWFYLFFGQSFNEAYTNDKTGEYTSAIRQFKWTGAEISDTSSIIDTENLHRRDLNVKTVVGSEKNLVVGYGGVFKADDHGYPNPVRVYLDQGVSSVLIDSLEQKTSQYECAMASVYNSQNKSNTHIFFGGIGEYQYHEDSGTWEYGDNNVPLPFVQTITQMTWQNDQVTQRIQIPPDEPQLPYLLGANAIFFPHDTLVYEDNVIDYQKLESDTVSIGYFYGGIKSNRPTSSDIYPTSLNTSLYEVFLYKK